MDSKDQSVIELDEVYKIFKQSNLEVVALKGVSLSVKKGELVVVMGPSGSGKTTLMNVISGLMQPSAGRVFIHGKDLTKMDEHEIEKLLQEEIGIVFQFFNLIPTLSARGNIELPMIIAKKSKEYIQSTLENLLEEVNMRDRAHHNPFALSGGEKQRIAIAAALANNPSIILADEPTGNVDSLTAQKIMDIFRNYLLKHPEKCIVVVTHDPNFRRVADRTLILKDGQIIKELEKSDFKQQEITQEGLYDGVELDAAEKVLHPSYLIVKFQDIYECPNCHSDQIEKTYSKDESTYQIKNNQVVTQAAVICHKCGKVNMILCSIRELR